MKNENQIDKRVVTPTSILEQLCKESIAIAWKNKDYKTMSEYLITYSMLHNYNEEVETKEQSK